VGVCILYGVVYNPDASTLNGFQRLSFDPS
jgi:hypothetical protein